MVDGEGNRRALIGREPELARIQEFLNRAAAGGGGALVVRGEPGIGKSRLLAYAHEHSGETKVLSTRGLQAESDLPFAGLSELLAPVMGHLGDIRAPQRAALEGALARGRAVPGDRFAAYMGVLSLLAAAAEEAPLLVLVDDAHWLDSASTQALLFVARRLGDERIALLFAVRDGEPSPSLARWSMSIGTSGERRRQSWSSGLSGRSGQTWGGSQRSCECRPARSSRPLIRAPRVARKRVTFPAT